MKKILLIAAILLLTMGCAGNKPAVKETGNTDISRCEEFYRENEIASKDLNIKVEELNKEFEISKFTKNLVCLENIICDNKTYCIAWENIDPLVCEKIHEKIDSLPIESKNYMLDKYKPKQCQ